MRKYPYKDEKGYEWHNENCYTDPVGGEHDSGIGWNPNGIWCGECNSFSCEGCVNEYCLPLDEEDE